jgi:hypothetical protein
MTFTGVAGVGSVMVAAAVNLVCLRAGLPMPMARKTHHLFTDSFVAVGDVLDCPSAIAPDWEPERCAVRLQPGAADDYIGGFHHRRAQCRMDAPLADMPWMRKRRSAFRLVVG